MIDEAAAKLLHELSSGRVDEAWREFLGRFTPAIMRVVSRHEADDERAAQCLEYVCAALSDDDFRRLRSYRADGPASFRTWLLAVVANLCVDWRRREQGRVRPPRCVERLSALDRQVFRCIFERGMSRAQCAEALAPLYPGLTVPAVAEINARLFALLTPQQRWQLSVRSPERTPVAAHSRRDDDEAVSQVTAPGPGPDELAEASQDRRRLRDAVAALPAEQRLLLRLRYERNLTLAEVARLTGQPDPFRVNRQIKAALRALTEQMAAPQGPQGRKSP